MSKRGIGPGPWVASGWAPRDPTSTGRSEIVRKADKLPPDAAKTDAYFLPTQSLADASTFTKQSEESVGQKLEAGRMFQSNGQPAPAPKAAAGFALLAGKEREKDIPDTESTGKPVQTAGETLATTPPDSPPAPTTQAITRKVIRNGDIQLTELPEIQSIRIHEK